MQTLTDLKNQVKHALGNGEPSNLLSSTQIINEAGRFLVTCHPWAWRERPSVSLSFTSGQSYVELPEDFGEIVGFSMSDSLNDSLRFTTLHDLAIKRGSTVQATSYYEAAIVYPSQESRASGLPTPRMEIWPTPGAQEDGATIFYRARWLELTEDDHVANVPVFMESLLIAIVRAFAQGYEEGMLNERLQSVLVGPLHQQAMRVDGLIQPSYGRIANGAIASAGPPGRLPWDSTADPQ